MYMLCSQLISHVLSVPKWHGPLVSLGLLDAVRLANSGSIRIVSAFGLNATYCARLAVHLASHHSWATTIVSKHYPDFDQKLLFITNLVYRIRAEAKNKLVGTESYERNSAETHVECNTTIARQDTADLISHAASDASLIVRVC